MLAFLFKWEKNNGAFNVSHVRVSCKIEVVIGFCLKGGNLG